MKNQKNIVESGLQDDNLLVVIKEIEQSLDSIEHNTPIYTPDLNWFENMVLEEKHKLRKKLIFDVTAFTVVALFILSIVLFSLYRIPIIFFAIQGCLTMFMIAYFSIQYVKRVKET